MIKQNSDSNIKIYLSINKLISAIDEYASLYKLLDRWTTIISEDNHRQYYDNSGNTEQVRFDRVVAFMDNDMTTLTSNTLATLNTLEEARKQAIALICACEEFPEIVLGGSYEGPIFYENTAVSSPVDELYFNDQFCSQDTCAGVIKDETDNVKVIRKKQATKLEYLRGQLDQLQIIDLNVSGYLGIVEDCNEKENNIVRLFNCFRVYVAGVGRLNRTVSNALSPLIDPEAKEFHPREYNYTLPEKKNDALIYKVYTARMQEMSKKYGTVSESFITITDDNGNPLADGYGGNQSWFKDYLWLGKIVNVDGNGCGVIAAVNQYLYLTGQTTITKKEYIELVRKFVAADDLSEVLPNSPHGLFALGRAAAIKSPIGAFPRQIGDYVQNMCFGQGVQVTTYWDFFEGYEQDYDSMKEQLENGIPVIWAVHDWDTATDDVAYNGIQFYKYDEATGTYNAPPYDKPESHYVTAVAIIEDYSENATHNRMVEISSWGQKYYVDYDEYVEWAVKNVHNQPFSSITHTEIGGTK